MSLPRTEFDYQMNRLGAATKPISDEQDRVFWEELKNLNEQYFIKAISYLMRHHKYRSFPLIADILLAYKKEIHDDPQPTAADLSDNFICELCGGTGWATKMEYDPICRNDKPMARYCSCKKGVRLHDNHQEYYRRKGLLKTARIEDGVWDEGY